MPLTVSSAPLSDLQQPETKRTPSPDRRRNFPDPPIGYPVRCPDFPVRLRREFDPKGLDITYFSGRSPDRSAASKSRCLQIFKFEARIMKNRAAAKTGPPSAKPDRSKTLSSPWRGGAGRSPPRHLQPRAARVRPLCSGARPKPARRSERRRLPSAAVRSDATSSASAMSAWLNHSASRQRRNSSGSVIGVGVHSRWLAKSSST